MDSLGLWVWNWLCHELLELLKLWRLLLMLLIHHLVLLHLLELLFLTIDLVEIDHFLVGQMPNIFIN